MINVFLKKQAIATKKYCLNIISLIMSSSVQNPRRSMAFLTTQFPFAPPSPLPRSKLSARFGNQNLDCENHILSLPKNVSINFLSSGKLYWSNTSYFERRIIRRSSTQAEKLTRILRFQRFHRWSPALFARKWWSRGNKYWKNCEICLWICWLWKTKNVREPRFKSCISS